MMYEEGDYYSASEVFACLNSLPNSKKKKMMMMNKRRFSDEQVRSLESIFENETKLEPKKKVQLARELGLQPRQVAIWFQNKRARYKSKQLERDYSILRASYNALSSQFDNLKKEHQSLILQVQKLKELAKKTEERENQRLEASGGANNTDSSQSKSESDQDNQKGGKSEEWELGKQATGSEYGGGCSIISSDEGSSENTNNNYFGIVEEDQTGDQMLKMVEPVVHVQEGTGGEGWEDELQSGGLMFDQIQHQGVEEGSQWWDFWS